MRRRREKRESCDDEFNSEFCLRVDFITKRAEKREKENSKQHKHRRKRKRKKFFSLFGRKMPQITPFLKTSEYFLGKFSLTNDSLLKET